MSYFYYVIGVTVLLCCVTLITRGLPFLFGDWIARQHLLVRLGEQLPAAIIVALMIYYMIMLARPSHWHNLVWQVIALLITLALQWRFRKTIVSLVVGTAAYLLLQGLL
jgi:branched-subunit amino acid transport protein AzlD